MEATVLALLLRRVVSQFTPLAAAARGLALHEAEPLSEVLTPLLNAGKGNQVLTTCSAMP